MSDYKKKKLSDDLARAYMALLHWPHDAFRTQHQELYARLRDAIAELRGWDVEFTQNGFEEIVAEEKRLDDEAV